MQQMLLLANDSARSRQLEHNLKSAFPGLRLLVATTCSEARCLAAYHAPAVMVMPEAPRNHDNWQKERR